MQKGMSEKRLITIIARETWIHPEAVKRVIEHLKKTIEEEVMKKERTLNLRNIGTFRPAIRKINGALIKHISFKTSKRLKSWYREYV